VSGGTLSIAVADDGPGFEPAMLERAFDPFTRGAGATYDGSGLGLAIVSVIAAAHRGRVAVANTPGGGAVVTLEVACGAVDAALGAVAAESLVAASAHG
jgi:signal transduction histidine kinase